MIFDVISDQLSVFSLSLMTISSRIMYIEKENKELIYNAGFLTYVFGILGMIYLLTLFQKMVVSLNVQNNNLLFLYKNLNIRRDLLNDEQIKKQYMKKYTSFRKQDEKKYITHRLFKNIEFSCAELILFYLYESKQNKTLKDKQTFFIIQSIIVHYINIYKINGQNMTWILESLYQRILMNSISVNEEMNEVLDALTYILLKKFNFSPNNKNELPENKLTYWNNAIQYNSLLLKLFTVVVICKKVF